MFFPISFCLFSFFVSPLPKTKVYLHLENLNDQIIHTGVSFKENLKTIRYDYRWSHSEENYITTRNIRDNIELVFVDYAYLFEKAAPALSKEYKLYRKTVENTAVTVFLGMSKYGMDEIMEFEKTIPKMYILGVNDCRHYTNRLLEFTIDKQIPIWRLIDFKKNYIENKRILFK